MSFTKKRLFSLGTAIVMGLTGGVASAATTGPVVPDVGSTLSKVDAGTLAQQEKMKQELAEDGIVLGDADIKLEESEKPALDIPDTVKFQVNDFKITGQDMYPEDELKAMVSDMKGKIVSFKDLQAGADKLTSFFREKGYLASRVYVPVQTVDQGIVEYTCVLAKFDGLTINNHTDIHDGALERETRFLQTGGLLTRSQLERAVWLLSDLAGADAKATLTTGETSGTVHVTIDLNPHIGKQGLFTIDNWGNRSTGYWEYGLNYDFLNLAKEGDHMAVGLSTTGAELINWGANYTLPTLRDGFRMKLGFNSLDYSLGSDWSYLDGVGYSKTASIGFEDAIRRSQKNNLYWSLMYNHSWLKDEYRTLDGWYSDRNGNSFYRNGIYGDKEGDDVTLSLYGDEQDHYGASDWRVDLKWGNIDNQTPDDAIFKIADANSHGYVKLRTNYLRRQNLNDRLYLMLTGRFQLANQNLDSSEHFSLGGPNGVRAYPTSEASGDQGYFTRAELRWLVPLKGKEDQQVHIATYLEHGGVWRNHDNSIDPGRENRRLLQGMGIGVIWSRNEDWFVRADYAWRLGSEPFDSDKSFSSGHFWIRAGVYF